MTINVNVDNNSDGEDFVNEMKEKFILAICEDDAATLRSILDDVTLEIRELLVNGEIQMKPSAPCSDRIVQQSAVTRALEISVMYQSWHTFTVLTIFGSKFLHQNLPNFTETNVRDNENNILHLLVYSYDLRASDVIVNMYGTILEKCGEEERRMLLLHKNHEGLTPLELAAQFSCSTLFTLFLYTEGVYRNVINVCGKFITNSFVFMNETPDDENSFLWQLTNIKCRSECIQNANAILKINLIRQLIDRKFKTALPIILVWFLLRSIPILLNIVADFINWQVSQLIYCFNATVPDEYIDLYGNTTWVRTFEDFWQKLNNSDSILTPIQGSLMLLFDVVEFVHILATTRKMPRDFSSVSNETMVNTGFYRLCVLCLSLSLLFAGISHYVDDWERHGVTAAAWLTLYSLSFISTLYFVQLFSSVGHFIIGFQRMLIAIFRFALFQLAFMCAFNILFQFVYNEACRNSNPQFVCSKSLSFYETFKMLLNTNEEILPTNGVCEAF
jgi:hypothetical protein